MVRYFTDLRVMVNGCLASLKATSSKISETCGSRKL